MAGHSTQRSTQIYTEEAVLAANLELCSKLAVPNLHHKFGVYDPEEIISFLNSFTFPHIKYTDLKDDWLNNLLRLLYTERYETQLIQDKVIDFTA